MNIKKLNEQLDSILETSYDSWLSKKVDDHFSDTYYEYNPGFKGIALIDFNYYDKDNNEYKAENKAIFVEEAIFEDIYANTYYEDEPVVISDLSPEIEDFIHEMLNNNDDIIQFLKNEDLNKYSDLSTDNIFNPNFEVTSYSNINLSKNQFNKYYTLFEYNKREWEYEPDYDIHDDDY